MDDMKAVAELVERIRPILAGRTPWVQGAVLADLLAMWLAGHTLGDPLKDQELREGLLAAHIDMAMRLVPVNEAIIHGRP